MNEINSGSTNLACYLASISSSALFSRSSSLFLLSVKFMISSAIALYIYGIALCWIKRSNNFRFCSSISSSKVYWSLSLSSWINFCSFMILGSSSILIEPRLLLAVHTSMKSMKTTLLFSLLTTSSFFVIIRSTSTTSLTILISASV